MSWPSSRRRRKRRRTRIIIIEKDECKQEISKLRQELKELIEKLESKKKMNNNPNPDQLPTATVPIFIPQENPLKDYTQAENFAKFYRQPIQIVTDNTTDINLQNTNHNLALVFIYLLSVIVILFVCHLFVNNQEKKTIINAIKTNYNVCAIYNFDGELIMNNVPCIHVPNYKVIDREGNAK